MTELEIARTRIVRLDGMISRFCAMHGCVPNVLAGETNEEKFREWLGVEREITDGTA